MRFRTLLFFVALLGLAQNAEARRQVSQTPDVSGGSSVSVSCAPSGGESLEISAKGDKNVFVVSLWGRGYQAVKMGSRSVSTDGVSGESGTGNGLVCLAGKRTTTDCQPQAVQVTFQSFDMQPGGSVSGTVSAAGETATFQGTWPGSAPQCK